MFSSPDDEKLAQYSVNIDPQNASAEGEDPLDAFMEGLDAQERTSAEPHAVPAISDSEDDEESHHEVMERVLKKARTFAAEPDSGSEGGGPRRSIVKIAPFDHSRVVYPAFIKDVYREHESIATLDPGQVVTLRRGLNISVTGSDITRCVCSFGHLNLPESILSVLRHLEFTTPTAVQAQTIPCALSGRDMISIAPTGSGKTMAFLLPATIHILENQSSEHLNGPRVLVLCPTRELAIQIEQEAYKFSRKTGQFRSLALTGGLSKYEQFKELNRGCDLVVGNPGRVLDLVQMKKGLELTGCTFCVLDEADRMFNMGFEFQLRQIVQRIRPDRQMLMFSATMPPRIERLAREVLVNPVRVVVGAIGQAASQIDQNVHITDNPTDKFNWLSKQFGTLLTSPTSRILVFVNSKTATDDVKKYLSSLVPVSVSAIHGDLDQTSRMKVMAEFRSGVCPVLVATDVAARGLDVSGVTCVIEFEPARDFDTHTHRIGRTGRAGMSGISWTLLSRDSDAKLAAHIVESIEALAQKVVPEDLMKLALEHAPFRLAREPGCEHLEDLEYHSALLAPGVHTRFGKLSKIQPNP